MTLLAPKNKKYACMKKLIMIKIKDEICKNHYLHKKNGKYEWTCANNPESCVYVVSNLDRKDRNYLQKYVIKYYCRKCLANGFRPEYKSNVKACPICRFDSDVQVAEFGIVGNSYQCIKCWNWFHKACIGNKIPEKNEEFICSFCTPIETLTSPTNKRKNLKRKRKERILERKKKRRKLNITIEIATIEKRIRKKKKIYAKREEERKEDRKKEKEKLAKMQRKIDRRLRKMEKVK
jgi:hypothetical protein